MSRQLKFRAWDDNEITYSDEYIDSSLTNNEALAKFFDDCHGCEVMQFTGLTDKNGKDVYEGDLLEVMVYRNKKEVTKDYISEFLKSKNVLNSLSSRIPNVEKGKEKSIWSVEHVDHVTYCGFKVYGKDRRFNKPIQRSTIFNSQAVVIGNIYETPHLLNKE